MNHPLYDQADSDDIDRLNFLNLSLPASTPLYPTSSTATTTTTTATASIKPASAPNPRRRPPPLVEPLYDLPQPVYPILRSPSHHHQSPKNNLNLTLKQFASAIQKSKTKLNQLIKRKKYKLPPTSSSSIPNYLHSPTPINLTPPLPLQTSLSNASTSQLNHYPSNSRWSTFQVDRHAPHQSHAPPFRSQSPYLDNLSVTSISPIDLNSPIGGRHSGTSSTELSWRLSHHQPESSPTHSAWFSKFSRPRTMMGGGATGWNDQNSVQTTLTSIVGTSPSSIQSRPLGSACPKRWDCFSRFSTNPNGQGLLQPVFGVSIKDALELSRETYHGLFGRAEVPTIVYKCGERLRCSEGMQSRGIFRINGNVKRMRQLESIFMDPNLEYGKRFDIAIPRSQFQSNNNSSLPDRANTSELEEDTQTGSYFSLHDVAGVLRRYLWSLPEPLVPYKTTAELIMAWRRMQESRTSGEGPEGREQKEGNLTTIEELERVLKDKMRTEELDLLNYLLEVLGLFSIRSEDNLMNSKNLAIVFQPGIMPIVTEKDQPQGDEEEDNHHPPSISSLSNRFPSLPFDRSRPRKRLPVTTSSSSHLSINAPTDPGTVEGIGLKEYLGQIDEVQEILRSLIDRFASLTLLTAGDGNERGTSSVYLRDLPHTSFNLTHELSSNLNTSLNLTGDAGG